MQASPKDLKKFFRLMPNNRTWGTRYWLYAIGYEDGITKIGMTGNPRTRFAQHAKAATSRIVWLHLGGAFRFSLLTREAEIIALRAGGDIGERLGTSELFRSLSKSDAIACLRLGLEDAVEANDRWPSRLLEAA